MSQITTLKNCVRGILKTFGRVLPKGLRSQFPARVRAAIDGHPVLGAIIEPTLQVLEAARAQLLVYDKAVIQRARSDDTARQLMSAPGVGTVVALAYMTGVSRRATPLLFFNIAYKHPAPARGLGQAKSGNPSGRPKRTPSLRAELEDALSDELLIDGMPIANRRPIVDKLVDLALKGNLRARHLLIDKINPYRRLTHHRCRRFGGASAQVLTTSSTDQALRAPKTRTPSAALGKSRIPGCSSAARASS